MRTRNCELRTENYELRKIFTAPFFFEIAEMRIAAPDAAFSYVQAGRNASKIRAVKL